MSFFDEAQTELDRVLQGLNSEEADKFKEDGNDVADQVLEAAAQMGGSIPGDIDDTLINKAKEIKEKLANQ